MPEEAAQAPENQDSLQEGTPPQEGTRADAPEDTNWEQRFKDTQASYTRSQQELSEMRKRLETHGLSDEWFDALSDPAGQTKALNYLLERHGYALPEEEEGEDLDDGDSEEQFHDPRVDDLIQHLTQREQDELVADITDHIQDLAKEAELKLSERQQRMLFAEAVNAGAQPEKTEEIFKEYLKELEAFGDERIKAWKESKKAPPPPSPPGQSGTQPVPIGDSKARLELANQVAQRALDAG